MKQAHNHPWRGMSKERREETTIRHCPECQNYQAVPTDSAAFACSNCGEVTELKREAPEVEMIEGIPFTQARPGYADLAKCVLCGMIVDVGGEIMQHIREHKEEEMERY